MRMNHEKTSWEIALIDPDGFAQSRQRRRPRLRLFPHIGLGYIAASLERNGDRVHVLDAGVATHNQVQHLLSRPVNLAGITITSFTFREAMVLAREIKRRYPIMPVVLGGPHVSIDPKGCLEEPAVDYAIRGEGEEAVVDLIEVLKRRPHPPAEVLRQIHGLVFRNCDKIETNPPVARRRALDMIPFPAWHLFPMDRYRQHTLLTSRGCPMDCAFCAIKTIWGPLWIRREAEQVVDEIEWMQRRWGRKLIHINDDNITMNPQHVRQVCQVILRRRLKVDWVAQGVRADALEPEMLQLMRQAGCHRVSLGIESAAPEVLEAVGKKETLEEISRAIRLCRDAGIQVLGMFMVGNPKDTKQTVLDSIRFAKESGIDLPAFYMALPYPGTRLWDYVKRQGRLVNPDYLAFDHMSAEPLFETPEFTLAERREVYAKAEKFCRYQMLKYHMKFWWPAGLMKRNRYEIGNEMRLLLKMFFFPFRMIRKATQRWSPGGDK
jgi:radical SAM superfamily enzyme YgiQ (UPF0313 family)